jgi:hypothetical protein
VAAPRAGRTPGGPAPADADADGDGDAQALRGGGSGRERFARPVGVNAMPRMRKERLQNGFAEFRRISDTPEKDIINFTKPPV